MNKIIIYDFDGTLTPYSMPKFEILEKSGLKDGANNPKFLELSKKKSIDKKIDLYEALYEVMFEIITDSGYELNDNNFSIGSDLVEYNNGVFEFLQMLSENNIDNYLLSSGMKTYLKNVSVSKYFKDIYATTFKYNELGEIDDIDFLMSDKNKVVAIKDILRKNGISEDDCSDVIYIGDGLTDFYAMEYVKKMGGETIFVYHDSNSKDITNIREKNVVSNFFIADFSSDSELTNHIKKYLKI